MNRARLSLIFLLPAILTSLCFIFSGRAQAASSVLITQSIDESKLVTLAGNTRPEVKAKADRGRVADSLPMEHMMLQLKRSPEQERDLEKFIDDIQDKSSPNFHHWIKATEFGERFGLSKQDLETIQRWLQAHGFTVNVVYEDGMLIDFSGTAGQVREAFRTEIHNLKVKGVKHIANMSDPKIPAALQPAVAGVVSLHDFTPRPMYKPRANYTFDSGGNTYYAVVPADLATIYNLNPLFSAGLSGQGQTIVLIEDSNIYSASDWTTFRSVFGLSSYTGGSLTQVHPAPANGPNNCIDPKVNGDDAEATLDVEYASASAPSAAIELASCANTSTFGGLTALQNILNASSAPPALVSISYGECEAGSGAASNAAFNAAYQQAVTEGVSVFVSSGDEGASSCSAGDTFAVYGIGVSGFASTPYNVAVGGTDFGDTYAGTNSTYWAATNNSVYGSALSYVPEIPWNDTCASQLIALNQGSGQTWGESGFCNTTSWLPGGFLNTDAGSGGPSSCATGTPSQPGIVGGTCAGWPKPSWQSLSGVPNDGVRDIPDVSLFAANGIWGHYYAYCLSDPYYGYTCTGTPDTWEGGGGTSFASPIMAGIQALVNQKTGERQGNPNPVYYSLAASEYGASGSASCNSTLGNTAGNSCIFYDVTLGDMDLPCSNTNVNCFDTSGTFPNGMLGVLSTSNTAYQPAFGTTTGWDFATGIGTLNAANLVNNWPEPAPNFSLVANPTSLTIIVGNTGNSAIAIVPQGGFHGNVGLSVSNLPDGVTASFSPNPATTASTLTLTVSPTAASSTSALTITGTSGSLTNSTNLNLTIAQGNPSFTLSAAPAAVTLVQGVGSASSTVSVTPVNGFSGKVSLTAKGLPKGVTAVFSLNPVTSSSTVTFTASSTAKNGTATVTITGTSGTLSASTTVTVTVNPLGNFALTAAPKTLTIARSGTGTSTITIVPKNGFDQNVSLTAVGLPNGVTASFSPSSTNTSSTLTLTAAKNATVGKSAIAVTGTYGTLTHQVLVVLQVTK
jgi:subtilase family serine protease